MNQFPTDIDPTFVALSITAMLVIMLVYPFAKGLLLYWTLKLVKFREPTYWRSFFCVLIGIGCALAVQTVNISLTMRQMDQFDPTKLERLSPLLYALLLLFTVLGEAAGVYSFFKESIAKTVGAIALFYVLCVVAVVSVVLAVLVFSIIVGAAVG